MKNERQRYADKVIKESKKYRNSKCFDLDAYQIVLVAKGNCSQMWDVIFPSWLRVYNLDKIKVPFYVWDSIFAECLEDNRIIDGRPKGTHREIIESVSELLDKGGIK